MYIFTCIFNTWILIFQLMFHLPLCFPGFEERRRTAKRSRTSTSHGWKEEALQQHVWCSEDNRWADGSLFDEEEKGGRPNGSVPIVELNSLSIVIGHWLGSEFPTVRLSFINCCTYPRNQSTTKCIMFAICFLFLNFVLFISWKQKIIPLQICDFIFRQIRSLSVKGFHHTF